MASVVTDDAATWSMIVETARTNAHDYYLSALLAPRAVRNDLIVMAAFEGELDRIAPMVSEPIRGEFRLQWWRDRMATSAIGEASGNPIADAIADVVRRRALPLDGLQASIDARSAALAPEEYVATEAAFTAFLDASEGAAMLRAARIMTGNVEKPRARQVIEAAGRARALAMLAAAAGRGEASARRLLEHAAGAALLCADRNAAPATALVERARAQLDVVRQLLPGQSKAIRLAALPVALVEPYLQGSQGEAESVSVLPIVRLWRLWRMARLAKL
ncbi:MAG: squalene/phytoene synthase family protein [Hyphomicrobiaceae bacterium]